MNDQARTETRGSNSRMMIENTRTETKPVEIRGEWTSRRNRRPSIRKLTYRWEWHGINSRHCRRMRRNLQILQTSREKGFHVEDFFWEKKKKKKEKKRKKQERTKLRGHDREAYPYFNFLTLAKKPLRCRHLAVSVFWFSIWMVQIFWSLLFHFKIK